MDSGLGIIFHIFGDVPDPIPSKSVFLNRVLHLLKQDLALLQQKKDGGYYRLIRDNTLDLTPIQTVPQNDKREGRQMPGLMIINKWCELFIRRRNNDIFLKTSHILVFFLIDFINQLEITNVSNLKDIRSLYVQIWDNYFGIEFITIRFFIWKDILFHLECNKDV